MLVLVTGGAGFIGSHTVDLLLERGYEVRILDALAPRVHPHGVPAYVPSEAELIRGDVSDPHDLARALAGAKGVFHLAAHQDYLPEFSRFVHTNTESAALLFELAVSDPKRYPVEKIVFASSQAVAGEGAYACPCCHIRFHPGPRSLEQLQSGQWEHLCPRCEAPARAQLIDEDSCNSPHTAYGISKYAIELLARSLGARHGIAGVCMRYTYVQGPRNSFHNAYSGIARRFALRLREGLPPICYEDGNQQRDYVHVRDVAAANVLAFESAVDDGSALNVGGGRAVSVLELARMMTRASGRDLEPLVPGEFRLGDTRHTVSDLRRVESIGWQPTIPVETNVREYLEWLEQQDPPTDQLAIADRIMAQAGVVRRAR